MAFNCLSLLIIPLFLFPLFSYSPVSSSDPPRGELFEEKSRLGSTPPSCYNKCNQCHPCQAVQAPSLPSLQQAVSPSSVMAVTEYDSSNGDNRYSNYKPLAWKCRCKDHFYNP